MNPTPEQQDRLAKVRALLAKAESTHHPEEAKTFSEKAQELMAKWAIDDAMLRASKGDAGSIETLIIWLDANEYRGPKIRLLADLAEVNDCKCVMYPQTYREVEGVRKRQFRFEIVGYDDDRAFVETLYTSLMTQAAIELIHPDVLMTMEIECEEGGHRIKWRNSFMMAYARKIRDRLTEAKERAKREAAPRYATGTMAMVLVGKADLVTKRFEALHPKLRKGGTSSAGQGMGSASELGHRAAGRADLGAPKIGGNRKQLGN